MTVLTYCRDRNGDLVQKSLLGPYRFRFDDGVTVPTFVSWPLTAIAVQCQTVVCTPN